MRIIPFIITLVVTIALVIVLSVSIGSVPPLGKFLSPQHGFWLNAEPTDKDFSEELIIPGMAGKGTVYFDERMVPHVVAEQENDLYFIQGYLHAKFRLWQMEFQTHAAGGRLTEILGVGPDSAILNNDRNMRRVGMVYGAKNSLRMMEEDVDIKAQLDAYTAGINAYIDQLDNSELPLEYRLLNYAPEPWTNLKTALFLKYMSYDLTGAEDDIEFTNARNIFNSYTFDKLYPIVQDSLDPIVPKGTVFDTAGVVPVIPPSADSLYLPQNDSITILTEKPDRDNGSNNWAVSGSKTSSGRPILCNDPHLGVNLPALWFEMQLTTSTFNVYGVSFPGAPSIIIGYNDSIAWGVTNAMRDVRDYFEIKFRDDSRSEYLYNGQYQPTELQVEEYLIRGGITMYDTVAYTAFGPVMYDAAYSGNGRTPGNINLAVKWKAHEPSNELKTFYLLNRSGNYDDYLAAIRNFSCPGQNFVFASKSNDIAIWQMASFPAKWKRQGDFIMPGTDSSYNWQGNIPLEENPHLINPDRGFVSSANQLPVDTTYPYYIGGHHDLYRGRNINRYLRRMQNISPADMQQLQNDNTNLLAEYTVPLLLKNINTSGFSDRDNRYLDMLRNWNLRNDPDETGITVFQHWLDSLHATVYFDELSRVKGVYKWPEDYTLVEQLLKDSAYIFIDDINTSSKEDLPMIITKAFRKIVPVLEALEKEGRLTWTKFKDSGVRHLLRLEALSRYHLRTGGGEHIINATKKFHAPSWKMVVHLTEDTEAYGIFPGGQSGNPGSRFYDNYVNDWAEGKYNLLWFMKPGEENDERIVHKMVLRGS